MALRALLLRNRLDSKKKELEDLRAKDADFATREKELEDAINEMTEETPEEDRKAVEDKVEELETEKGAHEDSKKKLEEEISGIEEEIRKEEAKKPEPKAPKNKEEERAVRTRGTFFGMERQERDAMFAREDVGSFLSQVRTCMREKRALENVGLTIPDVMLPMIRQITEETSKLMKYVTVQRVSGTSRQNIMGDLPEAYWDEMCATLKELNLVFHNMEMDGYKVSGYFAVCNAILEDSDVSLATELLNAIGKAIGKALDKAILYGKNVKMPMGIVTSLTMKTAPADYPATGRAWEDLSVSHVITGKATEGTAIFKEIVTTSGIVDNDYNTDAILWCMNKKTHMKLIAESIGANSAAAIVAGMNGTMPIVGGKVEEFKFIPDDTVILGYFKNYKLVERAGTKLAQSEHVRFIEDQTVFKGTARYDGDLAIREAFAVFGIGKAPVTTAPKFAGETTEEAELKAARKTK